MKYISIFNRIRGALYGVACGDALGGPVEFMEAEGIQKKYGRLTEMVGGGWLRLAPGEVTDDTQMTLCVARGIVENPEDPVPAVGRNFIAWHNSKPKDIGGTCDYAITEAIISGAKDTYDWLDCGRKTGRVIMQNGGNGALMRTVYTALYYPDKYERAHKTSLIGDMTHHNTESREICQKYADAVYAAIFGGHPISTISKNDYYIPGAAPTGYVVNTWSNTIEAIFDTDTFEDAVVEAVNRGGDADTIGAITGGLAGAYYGYENIPTRWVEALDPELRKELDKLAELSYKRIDDYYHRVFRGKI